MNVLGWREGTAELEVRFCKRPHLFAVCIFGADQQHHTIVSPGPVNESTPSLFRRDAGVIKEKGAVKS